MTYNTFIKGSKTYTPYHSTFVKKTYTSPSPSQLEFIRSLVSQRDGLVSDADQVIVSSYKNMLETHVIKPEQASPMINRLMGMSKPKAAQNVEPGIYSVEGTYVKVKMNREKTGTYSQYWITDVAPSSFMKGSGHWVFDRAYKARCTPEYRMTKSEAIQFGQDFGQCVRCGRELTAEKSIEQAIGPVCIKYFQI